MAIRDEFFTSLTKGARWDVGVSIKRSNPLPLDDKSVFQSYADLEAYLVNTEDKPTLAYPGQIVAVVNADSTDIYYLDQNRDPQPVGIIPTGDNKTIEVTEAGAISLKGAAQATAGQQPRIVNKGTAEEPKLELEWYTPDNSTVAGLQDTVGAIKETVDGIVEEDGTVTKEGLTHRVNALEVEAAKIGNAAKPESTEGAGDAKEATGLYKEIADEKARALAAEKVLDDAIKAIDFVDEDELADAIKDFVKTTDVNTELDKKADKETTYTKTEVNTAIDNAVKGILGDDINAAYDTLKEIQDILQGTDGEAIDGLIETVDANKQAIATLNGDANTAGSIAKAVKDAIDGENLDQYATDNDLNTYKGEVENALAGKADKSDIIDSYTKTEADDKFALKSNVYTKDEIAGLNHATKTEVENAVKAEADIARAAEKANSDAIAAIKDSETIDSFADVVNALAGKQDKLTEGAYATESYVEGKVKALADGAVATAQARADKGVADAETAQKAAETAQATATANEGKVITLQHTVDGYTGDDGIFVDGLTQKVANHETRMGTLEGAINGNEGIAAKVNNIINVELPKKANANDLVETNERVTGLEGLVGHEAKSEDEPATGLVKKTADNTAAIAALDARLASEEGKVDNDTTYTFEQGDNVGTFIVTPKGGQAQVVNTNTKAYVDDQINSVKNVMATDEEVQGIKAALEASLEALDGENGRVTIAEGEIDALQETIKGLSGAMHFEGVVNSDPTADGFDVTGYETGDVVIYGNKEFVFSEGKFTEFGDATGNASAISGLDERIVVLEKDVNDIGGIAIGNTAKINQVTSDLSDTNDAFRRLNTTAVKSVTAGAGLKVTKAKLEDGETEDSTRITLDIDESVVFVFNGGSATSEW